MSNIVGVFDIETLDTNPSGVVLSLGVVFFNLDKVQPFDELVLQGTNIYFDQQQQIDTGRTTSDSTLQWWSEQGEAAQECLNNPNQIDCTELYPALNELYQRIGFRPNVRETRWFSRGYFDVAFMDSFCRSFGMDPMMKYWCWRDSRSYLDALGIGPRNQKLAKPENMVAHNSMHDAAFDAYMLQRLKNCNEDQLQQYLEKAA